MAYLSTRKRKVNSSRHNPPLCKVPGELLVLTHLCKWSHNPEKKHLVEKKNKTKTKNTSTVDTFRQKVTFVRLKLEHCIGFLYCLNFLPYHDVSPTWLGHCTFFCSFTSFFHFLSTSWLKAGRPGRVYFS